MEEPGLLWFVAIDNRGRKWPVWLCCVEDEPELENCHGMTCGLKGYQPDTRRILINAWYSRSVQEQTLVHELLHVAADGHPYSENDEEAFIRILENPLVALLRRHASLKFPRRPKGYANLHRFARRKR